MVAGQRTAKPKKGRRIVFAPVADSDADRSAWYDVNLACMIEDCLGTVLPFGRMSAVARRALERRLHRDRWRPQAPARGYPRSDCYWLLADGQRIGTAGLGRGARGLHQPTASLYIRPDARGRGYAREALDVMEAAAKRAGFRGLKLDTDWCFGPIAGVYLKLGFRVSHWREFLTLARPGLGPAFSMTTAGPIAELLVDGESEPRLRAQHRGGRLDVESFEPEGEGPVGGDRVANLAEGGEAARERLATFALFLATHGFPLVRSPEAWARPHEHRHLPTPEALGRRIVRWEADARHWGEVVNSPRIPGLPYRTTAELDAPPSFTHLVDRLREQVREQSEFTLVDVRNPGNWRGIWVARAAAPRRVVAVVSLEYSGYGTLPPRALARWRGNVQAIVGATWRGLEVQHGDIVAFPEEDAVILPGVGLRLDLPRLYDGLDLDPMPLR